MRLGIFGGSFDPPHVGHLLAAVDAFDALQLDRLIFVPAATQPFKAGQPNTPGHLRLAMLQLMVGTDPRFEVSPVEIERDGLSYTVETLTAFAGQYPAAERFFLIGADAFAAFGQWREPRRITQLARVAVLQRAGEEPGALPAGVDPAAVTWLPTRRVDVSSTEVRERVRQGRAIRGFVSDAVAEFIATSGLYQSRGA